ncbi:hypothetical protein DF029_21650 [Burkholderia cepacia]|nr:hypothetical protein DF029_21650 [Burkholderia cepacia]
MGTRRAWRCEFCAGPLRCDRGGGRGNLCGRGEYGRGRPICCEHDPRWESGDHGRQARERCCGSRQGCACSRRGSQGGQGGEGG